MKIYERSPCFVINIAEEKSEWKFMCCSRKATACCVKRVLPSARGKKAQKSLRETFRGTVALLPIRVLNFFDGFFIEKCRKMLGGGSSPRACGGMRIENFFMS
jgi:hypothetical protein